MLMYDLSPRQVPCPICLQSEGKLLYRVTSKQAAQHFVLKEVHPDRHAALERHVRQLWDRDFCELVRCSVCGFVFADPFVAGDETFYTLAYDRTGYPKWKWEYAASVQAIDSLIRAGEVTDPYLLEIGAGDGAFVRHISPMYTPKDRVLCTEYSDYGRAKIMEQGFECRGQDIRDVTIESLPGLFDVVAMFQILEHMDRIDEQFAKLSAITSAKAHLFISVPNPERIYFNEQNGSLLDMPPNHIGRWNRECFGRIGGKHGWSIVEFAVEPEGLRSRVVEHLSFHYVRRRQNPNSVANRVERMRSRRTRRVSQAVVAGLYSLLTVRSIAKLITSDRLGNSLLVHLRKI